MEHLLIAIIIAALIYIVYSYFANKKKINEIRQNQEQIEAIDVSGKDVDYSKYSKKFLLTKNEYYFFKKLKPIADEMNMTILAKIRLADIVEPQKGMSKNEWYRYFAKIKSKHIDFALCDQNSLTIKLAVELNDSTHNREDRKQRDMFVENVFKSIKIPFLQTYGGNDLRDQIKQKLNGAE